MSRPEIETGPPAWEASTQEKSHSNSLLIAIRNFYIWAQECRDKITTKKISDCF